MMKQIIVTVPNVVSEGVISLMKMANINFIRRQAGDVACTLTAYTSSAGSGRLIDHLEKSGVGTRFGRIVVMPVELMKPLPRGLGDETRPQELTSSSSSPSSTYSSSSPGSPASSGIENPTSGTPAAAEFEDSAMILDNVRENDEGRRKRKRIKSKSVWQKIGHMFKKLKPKIVQKPMTNHIESKNNEDILSPIAHPSSQTLSHRFYENKENDQPKEGHLGRNGKVSTLLKPPPLLESLKHHTKHSENPQSKNSLHSCGVDEEIVVATPMLPAVALTIIGNKNVSLTNHTRSLSRRLDPLRPSELELCDATKGFPTRINEPDHQVCNTCVISSKVPFHSALNELFSPKHNKRKVSRYVDEDDDDDEYEVRERDKKNFSSDECCHQSAHPQPFTATSHHPSLRQHSHFSAHSHPSHHQQHGLNDSPNEVVRKAQNRSGLRRFKFYRKLSRWFRRVTFMSFWGTSRSRMAIEELYQTVSVTSRLTCEYVSFVSIAALIGCLGNATDNPVMSVAAMLCSPLMGPILAIALGVSMQRWQLVSRGALSLLVGITIAFVVGLLGGFFLAFLSEASKPWPTNSMLTRGETIIIPFGMVFAFLCGCAMAIAASGAGVLSNVGVALAASVLPPIITCGMSLTYPLAGSVLGDRWSVIHLTLGRDLAKVTTQANDLAQGAAVLFVCNLSLILIAAIVGLRLRGVQAVRFRLDNFVLDNQVKLFLKDQNEQYQQLYNQQHLQQQESNFNTTNGNVYGYPTPSYSMSNCPSMYNISANTNQILSNGSYFQHQHQHQPNQKLTTPSALPSPAPHPDVAGPVTMPSRSILSERKENDQVAFNKTKNDNEVDGQHEASEPELSSATATATIISRPTPYSPYTKNSSKHNQTISKNKNNTHNEVIINFPTLEEYRMGIQNKSHSPNHTPTLASQKQNHQQLQPPPSVQYFLPTPYSSQFFHPYRESNEFIGEEAEEQSLAPMTETTDPRRNPLLQEYLRNVWMQASPTRTETDRHSATTVHGLPLSEQFHVYNNHQHQHSHRDKDDKDSQGNDVVTYYSHSHHHHSNHHRHTSHHHHNHSTRQSTERTHAQSPSQQLKKRTKQNNNNKNNNYHSVKKTNEEITNDAFASAPRDQNETIHPDNDKKYEYTHSEP